MIENISVKDILDYCNRGADVCQKLHRDALKRYGETGTCCYPVEECQNCPNRNGGTNY